MRYMPKISNNLYNIYSYTTGFHLMGTTGRHRMDDVLIKTGVGLN